MTSVAKPGNFCYNAGQKGGIVRRRDKYVRVSRLIKRRTVANEACDNERVSVNGRVQRASYEVKPGDRIAIRFGARTLEVEVLSVADNVGKADAAAMYREIGGTTPGQS